jgi:hypothetical protein
LRHEYSEDLEQTLQKPDLLIIDNWQTVEVVLLIELNPKVPSITKFEKDFGALIEVKRQVILYVLKPKKHYLF